LASLAAVPFVSAGDRVDWYVSAASSAIGILPLLLTPLDVIADARELQTMLRFAPSPNAQLCAHLADAEHRLSRSAQSETDGRSPWMHAGNIALNTSVLLFLGLVYRHWEAGIVNGAVGAAVGEAMILSQPTDNIGDLARYRAGEMAFLISLLVSEQKRQRHNHFEGFFERRRTMPNRSRLALIASSQRA
jgi:hypothetical protein